MKYVYLILLILPMIVNAQLSTEFDHDARVFYYQGITTTVRDAITTPIEGFVIYNSTDSELQIYNGSTWVVIGGSAGIAIGSGIAGGTSGSVAYIDSIAEFAQDNSNFFWDAINKRLGIGSATPDVDFHIEKSVSGATVTAEVENESDTANSHARLLAIVGGTSAGDAYAAWQIPGGSSWSAGVDNSDGDKFKIGPSGNPSTGTPTITLSGGNVGIGTTSPGRMLDIEGGSGTGMQITSTAGRSWSLGDALGASNGVFVLRDDTASVNRFTITAAGNVGIGSVEGQSHLHVHAAADNSTGLQLTDPSTGANATDGATIRIDFSDDLEIKNHEAADINLVANGQTRLKIESTGRIGIGNNSPSVKLDVREDSSSSIIMALFHNDSSTISSGHELMRLAYPADSDVSNATFLSMHDGDGQMGRIYALNSAAVFYSSVSDARLKTNYQDFPSPLETLMKLKPRQYDWKENGLTDVGFIAQEMKEVYPYIVGGEADGDLETAPMSIDYGRLTPLLTAALQKAILKIESLERRLDELEAR